MPENPLKKNQDITLGIHSLSSEGQGVGRFQDVAVFVPFVLPGEEVAARIIKTFPNYALGKLIDVKRPSPDRVRPECAVFGKCGGCQLQNLAYEAQLSAKRRIVVDALTRLGGFSEAEALVKRTVGGEPYGYRNKGSFPVRDIDGEAAVGLFAPKSHRLIRVERCPIARGEVNAALKSVAGWLRGARIEGYDEQRHSGDVRHTMIRSAKSGVMAAIVTRGDALPKQAELLKALRGTASCVVHNVNPERTNTVLGARSRLISGETLVEALCGFAFSVSDQSFLQVNSAQAQKLYALVLEALSLSGGETVADAYCGVGTIAITLSAYCKKVVGMEIVPQAVDDARENASRNGVRNAQFHAGEAERLLPELISRGEHFDAVVLDPPRKGCGEAVLKAVLESGAQRVVYVSCNSATLARDAKLLCAGGYGLAGVTPVDMFPQSAHVEAVALLQREFDQ